MKSLKQLMLVASLAAMPALSFAQQMSTPATGATTAAAASLHAAQRDQAATQSQPPSRSNSGYAGDGSGYGAPAAGSSQSSVMHFAGKHSPVFDH
jgi:hypothetical protein